MFCRISHSYDFCGCYYSYCLTAHIFFGFVVVPEEVTEILMCHAHAKLTHKFAKYKNPSWSGWAFSEHLYSWQLVSDKYKLSVQDLSITRAQNKDLQPWINLSGTNLHSACSRLQDSKESRSRKVAQKPQEGRGETVKSVCKHCF